MSRQITIKLTEDEDELLTLLSKATRRSETSILIGGMYEVYDQLSGEEFDRYILYEQERQYTSNKIVGACSEDLFMKDVEASLKEG